MSNVDIEVTQMKFKVVNKRIFLLLVVLISSLLMILYIRAEPKLVHFAFKNLDYQKESQKWIVVVLKSKSDVRVILEHITELSRMSNFSLVVVGDDQSEWFENIDAIFLNLNDQINSNLQIVNMPHNSFTLKMFGYLFAIHRGARFIYETDDNFAPNVPLGDTFEMAPMSYGMVLSCIEKNQTGTTVNPISQPLVVS